MVVARRSQRAGAVCKREAIREHWADMFLREDGESLHADWFRVALHNWSQPSTDLHMLTDRRHRGFLLYKTGWRYSARHVKTRAAKKLAADGVFVYLAYVRPRFRRRGVLKGMVSRLAAMHPALRMGVESSAAARPAWHRLQFVDQLSTYYDIMMRAPLHQIKQ